MKIGVAASHRPPPPFHFRSKFGKAVAKVTDDLDGLLVFYDYPAG